MTPGRKRMMESTLAPIRDMDILDTPKHDRDRRLVVHCSSSVTVRSDGVAVTGIAVSLRFPSRVRYATIDRLMFLSCSAAANRGSSSKPQKPFGDIGRVT